MINEEMRKLGANRSVIRELFEYARGRRSVLGDGKVFDFTLGNPSVLPPEAVDASIIELVKEAEHTSLHGYTSAAGDLSVREAIASYVKNAFGFEGEAGLIYLTAGAAAALTSVLTAMLVAGDEVIALSPYFPEYKVFTERTGARLVTVPCMRETFLPDIDAIGEAITQKTKAILLNSPNNPTGVVYSEETISALSSLLRVKSAEVGHPIYIIADEPYRELAYDGAVVPYIPKYYENTVVCYSFSKSLSLPGERIGYALVSPRCAEKEALYEAICGAGRALGFVCAPSLFQFLIPKCLGKTADVSIYDRNRRLLYEALTSFGFEAVKPCGAFYLFLKAPNGDANAFCEAAKAHELIFVSSDDFGCGGYVRIAYCVTEEKVKRSLAAFKMLAKEYGLKGENDDG